LGFGKELFLGKLKRLHAAAETKGLSRPVFEAFLGKQIVLIL